MYFIAHRGLINGPDTDQENKIQTIEIALNNGFDVEVDVRFESCGYIQKILKF